MHHGLFALLVVASVCAQQQQQPSMFPFTGMMQPSGAQSTLPVQGLFSPSPVGQGNGQQGFPGFQFPFSQGSPQQGQGGFPGFSFNPFGQQTGPSQGQQGPGTTSPQQGSGSSQGQQSTPVGPTNPSSTATSPQSSNPLSNIKLSPTNDPNDPLGISKMITDLKAQQDKQDQEKQKQQATPSSAPASDTKASPQASNANTLSSVPASDAKASTPENTATNDTTDPTKPVSSTADNAKQPEDKKPTATTSTTSKSKVPDMPTHTNEPVSSALHNVPIALLVAACSLIGTFW